MPVVSLDDIKAALAYEPETGRFTYRTGPRAGVTAGHGHSGGYRVISVLGRRYFAHRLAWLYMTGEWPASNIDHVNLDAADNRWSNLRLCDQSQNSANVPRRKSNKTGLKGVVKGRADQGGGYLAFIHVNRVTRYLGKYSDPQSAHQAYLAAAREVWGDFARAD